jgi:hypothetical protein
MVRGMMCVRCMSMLRWLYALMVSSHIFDQDRFSGDARIHDCIVEEAVLVRVGVSALSMLCLETCTEFDRACPHCAAVHDASRLDKLKFVLAD